MVIDYDYANDTPNLREIHELLELVLLCALTSRDFIMVEKILDFGRSRMYLLGATDEVCKFLLAFDTQSLIDGESQQSS